MKTCFGYLRVSSKKQGEGTSLDEQKEAIEAFCARSDILISKWFVETVTAAKRGRPEFNALIKALRQRKADGVVMHKIDRSARNFFDWAKIGELSDAGIEVHFATESLDFRSRGGRLAANVQMAVAEDYCRNLSQEIRKGQRGCLKKGLYPFKAPIGYVDHGKGELKTLDPERAPLVRKAFELYATGNYSARKLRLEMTKRGLSNVNGRPISKGCLEKFLKNPFYTGVIKIRKTGEVYQGDHKPLISVELFEAVQNIRQGKCGKKVTRHNHTYRGLFKCGSCGKFMIAEKQFKYVYYRCQTRACPKNIVREDRLEEIITRTLAQVAIADADAKAITETVATWERKDRSREEERGIALQISHNNDRLEKLTDALLDGLIDNDTYLDRKEKLLLEAARLQKRQQELRSNEAHQISIAKFLETIKNLEKHYEIAKPPTKRLIAETATSKRIVTSKNVSIEPANWLQTAKNAVAVLSCADARPNSRRQPETQKAHLRELIELSNSTEAGEMKTVFEDPNQQAKYGSEQQSE